MRERLEKLRKKLGLQWKELADLLDISVPMMGCLRRGDRNPSSKLLLRIASLETDGVALQEETRHSMSKLGQCPHCADKDKEIEWLKQQLSKALDALAAKPSPAAARVCVADYGRESTKGA